VWKSFQEKFAAHSDLNREENFLSSDEVVNATRVVQKEQSFGRTWLFVPERLHRIDLAHLPGREIAGNERYGDEERRN